jgi:hypothetical protein
LMIGTDALERGVAEAARQLCLAQASRTQEPRCGTR